MSYTVYLIRRNDGKYLADGYTYYYNHHSKNGWETRAWVEDPEYARQVETLRGAKQMVALMNKPQAYREYEMQPRIPVYPQPYTLKEFEVQYTFEAVPFLIEMSEVKWE